MNGKFIYLLYFLGFFLGLFFAGVATYLNFSDLVHVYKSTYAEIIIYFYIRFCSVSFPFFFWPKMDEGFKRQRGKGKRLKGFIPCIIKNALLFSQLICLFPRLG